MDAAKLNELQQQLAHADEEKNVATAALAQVQTKWQLAIGGIIVGVLLASYSKNFGWDTLVPLGLVMIAVSGFMFYKFNGVRQKNKAALAEADSKVAALKAQIEAAGK